MNPKAKLIRRRLGDNEAIQIVGVLIRGQYYDLANESEIAISVDRRSVASLTLTLAVSDIEFVDEPEAS